MRTDRPKRAYHRMKAANRSLIVFVIFGIVDGDQFVFGVEFLVVVLVLVIVIIWITYAGPPS